MNYFKILFFLQKGDKTLFDISIGEQKAFLESLGEPKDDIDRGYKQYLCQNFFVSKWKVFLFNVAAAVIMPFLIFGYLIKGLFTKKKEVVSVMIEHKNMEEVVPDVVKERFSPNSQYWYESSSMSFSDVPFLFKLIARAPYHPYFVLKAWMNIVYYSEMIRSHQPKVMIQFGEFSFSSSILTAYCHCHGVKHIDIMHGEKLFFIRDAFFHYDECYVWDEHYVKLFMSMKAEPTQFRIALPPSISIDTNKYRNPKDYADYKYYLAIYTEQQIMSIIKAMSFVKREGKSIKYRPHPRYSDMSLLRKYVSEGEIEQPNEVSIMESISNLQYAVGSYTTVLSQAFFSGKEVLLDDVTFGEEYQALKEHSYILSSKYCKKLSECQVP